MGYLSGWKNRTKLIIDHTKVDENLIDFPLLLTLTLGTHSNFFSEMSSSDSKKIAVTKNNGITQCSVEIEQFDVVNSVVNLWTKVPTVASGSDTILYLYYDSSKDDNTVYVGDIGSTPAQNVWDDYFVGVWHMNQDPSIGGACIKDSTSNANHGTPDSSMTSGDLVDGKIGKALDFDGSNDYVSCGNVSSINTQSALSVEAVLRFNQSGTASYEGALVKTRDVGGGYAGFILGFRNQAVLGAFNFTVNGVRPSTDIVLLVDTDTYVVGVTDCIDINTYKDGAFVDSNLGNSLSLDALTEPLVINTLSYLLNYCPNTIISEVRISDNVRSAAWIKATYYSNWNQLINYEHYVGYFSGYVLEEGSPVSRKVCLHNRDGGNLIVTTTSSGSGYYYMETTSSGSHYIVCLDDVAGEEYNDLIIGNAFPTEIT